MGYYRRIHREVRVMESKFKNGVVISYPENVSFVFASTLDESGKADGEMYGNTIVLSNLFLHMFKKLFNQLDSTNKVVMLNAFAVIAAEAAMQIKEDNND